MVRIDNVGEYGIIKDVSCQKLPLGAWSDGLNVRSTDNAVEVFRGDTRVYNPTSVNPYHVLPVTIAGARYWIYAGTGKIYCVNGSTHTDLTRAAGGDYSGAANTWTSCVIGGLPVMNDGSGSNYPQSWDLNTANNFGNLANWQANTYCKSIRTYRNYLVALNITKTTTAYPFMVKWSHPADPGAVPASWDQTDATKDAGEFDLSEGQDAIVDGLQLRDAFMIYKESSVWRMDYVGGDFVMRFQKVLGKGALNRNCIVEYDGNHVVLTSDDVVIHDGQSGRSLLDGRYRRALFSDMHTTNYTKSFVFKNQYMNEVWVCYPSSGSTNCDTALVINIKTGAISTRELDATVHANTGLVESNVIGTWSLYTPDAVRVMCANLGTIGLYVLDSGGSFAAPNFIERRCIPFGDFTKRYTIRSVRPMLTGTAAETVFVKVGYAETPTATPTYTSGTYTIGTTVSCDFLVEGRYLSIKIEDGTSTDWHLDGLVIDVVESGEW